MLDLYLNIKNLRLKKGLTQTELAKRLGYADKSMIAKIENGKVDLPQSKIVAFAKVFDVSPQYLMGWENDESYDIDNIYKIDKISLPLLGSVACGTPKYADEDRESYVLAGTEIQADFCLRCQGDSMINARINDGDIVFVRKQDIVNNGEIAVIVIDDEATLKRFYYYKEQNMVILRPENSKYQDIVLQGEDLEKIKVIGKAIAFQSDVE